MDNVPWRRIVALATLIVGIVCIIIWHHRLRSDFIPLDRSFVGPNLLASVIQGVVVLVIAVLIWPPTRNRITIFFGAHFDSVHTKVDTLVHNHKRHEAHNEWAAKHLAELYESHTGKEPEPHPHFDTKHKDSPS